MITTHTIILFGCVGGAIPDLLRIVKCRYEPSKLKYLKTRLFWIGFVLLIVGGGFAAWVAEAQGIKEALAYGFSAPQVISSLLGSQTDTQRGGLVNGQNLPLRGWWGI
jgi:hypothetical protein